MENLQEEQLKNLKRKLLDKKNKVEAMIFELRELNDKILDLKPDNSEVVQSIGILCKKIEALDIKAQINIGSDDITKVELEQENVIKAIADLKEKVNSNPNADTNKLIATLIERVSALEFKPEITVESKEVTVNPVFDPHIEVMPAQVTVESKEITVSPIFDPHIEVKPAAVNISKEFFASPIRALSKGIQEFFTPFFDRIVKFIYNIEEYIKEPDRVIITNKTMTEWYGKRKVTYKIKDDGTSFEVIKVDE